jgi:epoxyqueuosine reductase
MKDRKILLHVCCGPCACWPVKDLSEKGVPFTCFWYNPNIHPFNEFRLRLLTFRDLQRRSGIDAVYDESRDIETWLEKTRPGWSNRDKKSRCTSCYSMRLEKTAETAVKMGLSSISTTLLYSRYQYHDEVRELGEEIAARYKLDFYYDDFRKGWKEGIRLSKEAGLYRQATCGCVFSSNETHDALSLKQGR